MIGVLAPPASSSQPVRYPQILNIKGQVSLDPEESVIFLEFAQVKMQKEQEWRAVGRSLAS
jgi:hypothetical protein